MQVIRDQGEMQRLSLAWRREGERIGFVPTMGYLHEGHLSLVRIAKRVADRVVLSLFVNPLQFGPREDLARYPRDFDRDAAMCRAEGVDVLFAPEREAMYAGDHSTFVEETRLGVGLCGASRPGHFRGVTTVVCKLFHQVQPDLAVFGEKDAQQIRIIRRMVRDLSMPVEIVGGPIIREADGLAMSSRNAMLRPDERAQAVCLSRGLADAGRAFSGGERDSAALLDACRRAIDTASLATVDYLALVDDETLEPVRRVETPALLAIAVKFPSARLIDNVVLRP